VKLAIYAKAPGGDFVIEEFLDDADVFIDEPVRSSTLRGTLVVPNVDQLKDEWLQ
jgi:hypothetical protein